MLAKGLLGDRFSLLAFCAAQVVIDVESGYHLVQGDWPVHRFFHTVIGATIACSAVVLILRLLSLRYAPAKPPRGFATRFVHTDLLALRRPSGAIATATISVLGHVLPDSIMHADVRPFAPFTDQNPFYGLLSLGPLHWILMFVGLASVPLVLRGPRHRA
jgi:hypothetical protein